MSSAEITLHVQFSPEGTVIGIDEKPAGASAQQWFDFLTTKIGGDFRSLAGGRGMFRSLRGKVEGLQATFANS